MLVEGPGEDAVDVSSVASITDDVAMTSARSGPIFASGKSEFEVDIDVEEARSHRSALSASANSLPPWVLPLFSSQRAEVQSGEFIRILGQDSERHDQLLCPRHFRPQSGMYAVLRAISGWRRKRGRGTSQTCWHRLQRRRAVRLEHTLISYWAWTAEAHDRTSGFGVF